MSSDTDLPQPMHWGDTNEASTFRNCIHLVSRSTLLSRPQWNFEEIKIVWYKGGTAVLPFCRLILQYFLQSPIYRLHLTSFPVSAILNMWWIDEDTPAKRMQHWMLIQSGCDTICLLTMPLTAARLLLGCDSWRLSTEQQRSALHTLYN